MNLKTARKTLLRTALAVGLVVLLLAGTSPWWLGWAIGLAVKGSGVSIDQYELQGYGSFRLQEIHYADAQSGLEAQIDFLQTATPPAILWKKLTGQPLDLSIGTITVEQGKPAASPQKPSNTKATPPSEPSSPAALAAQGFKALDLLESWPVEVHVEKIVYTADPHTITVEQPCYEAGVFTTTVNTSLTEQSLAIRVDRPSPSELRVTATLSPEPVHLKTVLALTTATELDLNGEINWRDQPATFSTQWQGQGLLPDRAALKAEDWALPEDLLTKDQRPGYGAPHASLAANWDGQQYTLSLDASAAPEDETLPALTARIAAEGDTEALKLDQFSIEGGWITANLSEPVNIPLNDLKDLPAARFNLEADLSGQSLLPARGQITASLVADDRPDNAYPLVTAKLEARGLAYEAYTADSADVEAELDWPQLTLSRGTVTLPQDSSLAFSGSYDIEKETLSAIVADIALSGQLVQQYTPQAPDFERLRVQVTVEGPTSRPRHTGDITITQLAWADDHIDTDLHWSGEHGALKVLSGKGGNDALDFTWEGSADIGPDRQSVTLSQARLEPRDYANVELQKPFTLSRGEDGVITLTEVSILGSEGGSVHAQARVDWPRSGTVSLSANEISPVWLKAVTDAKLPFPTHLDSLNVDAQWDNGPIVYTVKGEAIGEPEDQPTLSLSLDIAGDAEGLRLNSLSAQQGQTQLANAHGQVPVTLDPTQSEMLRIETEAPADFYLVANPGSTSLWRWLQEQYHLVLEQPSLELAIKGSLAAPTGKLSASLAKLESTEGGDLPELPPVDSLRVDAAFSPDEITLSQLSLNLADRPLSANGKLPMSEEAWEALISDAQPPKIEDASGTLRLDDVPLSAFSGYLPDVLRSSGTVGLSAELKPGLNWSGQLNVEGVETMPLPQLGSVTGIQAQMQLVQTRLNITRASAQLGGQELAITGTIDVESLEQPRFDLAIKGEQIPFVRSPGLILRGSPDLTVVTDDEDITTVAGSVKLDESFFTIDLTSLTTGGGGGGGGGGPGRPFPYVSIEDEPLASWRLRIDIEGDEFLRVRTPVFEGMVSADLQALGTMREPMVLGQVLIDQGVVMFPFANLRIQQGNVTIRQDQPDQPIIDITATGRAYGYDLVMRVTGGPDDPQLSFTSTPALEQGDILLMITAGRMPDSDQRSTQSRLTGLGVFIGNTILVDLGLVDPLDDQLQVYVGEDVTLTGKDTIRVIYRIDEDWAIVGQYDRFDDYTLDFKWTVYSD
ncbi:translocation/assembly module TamB domain-containing protein [Ruficoccus sp. ZRK36]|uniref:translocation/assembly module TamB domain-containing protein n=1 Tax=Ruficoccus sp. ZRK36 TaxID=2866311 RepID=UPI001C73A044|nr:translocation/assembly module TamB domain-containing protein [Ruficoccus sp. ZRK36]QYY35376.1 translocation/assembly module TamB [Ruficoccus sp. ZRK36]